MNSKPIIWKSCGKCHKKNHAVDNVRSWYPFLTWHEFEREKSKTTRRHGVEDEAVNINQHEENNLIESESHLSTNLHIDELPLEVLDNVFEYLDGYSLYYAGDVCTRWRDLIQSRTEKHQKEIERTFDELWPYQFRELYHLMDYQVFSSLLMSVNCIPCLLLERDDTTPIENDMLQLPGLRRMIKEMEELPYHGIHAFPFQDRDRMDKVIARIEGPINSPYENGVFYLMVKYSTVNFGWTAPKIRFLTKIFHPAVSCHGYIAVDILCSQWSPALTIRTVLLSILSLLTDTDFEQCKDTPIGKLFKENKPEYERIARIWTEKYAMQHLIHPVPPPLFVEPAQDDD